MYSRIKAFFQSVEIEIDDDELSVIASSAAMLLFEVAWADHEITDVEIEHISNALSDLFELPEDQIDQIVSQARTAHEDSISVFSFTREITECFSQAERFKLITAMWQLALSDSEIHKYEEHIIRKIADLIYVSHADFIKAKLHAKQLMGSTD